MASPMASIPRISGFEYGTRTPADRSHEMTTLAKIAMVMSQMASSNNCWK